MAEVVLKKISYKELRDKSYLEYDDRYGMLSFVTETVRETLLACPNNKDSKTAIYLSLFDNIVVGRALRLGTQIKIDNDIVWGQTGGSLEVHEEYRHYGAGVDIIWDDKVTTESDLRIGALLTSMAAPIHKRLKYSFFEIPQYIAIRSFKDKLKLSIKNVALLEFCTWIADLPLRFVDMINWFRYARLKKHFKIQKEAKVPEWVGDVATTDAHKYKELHNTQWLQWNLDFNMDKHHRNIQSLYTIYDKDNNPQGFFMTKERYEASAGIYNDVIKGTIVEWGTVDNHVLSEADIMLMAIPTFSKDVFHITTVTNDKETERRLKTLGYIRHGIFCMSINDRLKQYNDIADMNLWRIRYGCCNTIIL